MKAKLIVEVTTSASPSTIALAAAARETGGRLICILPELVLDESKRVIKDSGLKDLVEFKTGEPSELLSNYENIDFSLVDCKSDDYSRLLRMLDVNPKRSVVVANNLVGERKGLEGNVRRMNNKEKLAVRSLKNPIGKGMEVTVIGRKRNEIEKRDWGGGISTSFPPPSRSLLPKRDSRSASKTKSKWLVTVDKESGEEHFFRVPK